MFRRERPQKGRYRQFFQIGAEAIGSEAPVVDAEVIEMVVEVLKRAGLSGFKLLMNSVGDQNCRPQYVELLRERLREVAPRLCGDCQRRAVTNPLRVLDCKVPEDQPIIDALPSILDHLCEPCKDAFRCGAANICGIAGSNSRVRPRMVRGLDYYMRTTFEIVHGALGAQNSVLGGGRYDGLAEALGSKSTLAGSRLLDRRRPSGDELSSSEHPEASRWTCLSRRWATAARRHMRHCSRMTCGAAGRVEVAPKAS